MKILIALPDHKYFIWQIMVQINNLKKYNMDVDLIYVIGKNKNAPISDELLKIMNDENIKCQFHVFDDLRVNPKYPSSLRPNILAQLFDKCPQLLGETFFYTDPDVLFTKKIDFSKYETDNVWYLSDTRSYIDSRYIISKSPELFAEMCDIVGINPAIVVANDQNAGGAQYIMKNINADFWRKVEADSEKLYIHMLATSNKYHPQHPIQAWTSDMWAVLWNALYFHNEVKIVDELTFSWATDMIDKWDMFSIFHNAGAFGGNDLYFVKTDHQVSPFNKELKCSDKFCSYNYMKEIKETEITFKDLLF